MNGADDCGSSCGGGGAPDGGNAPSGAIGPGGATGWYSCFKRTASFARLAMSSCRGTCDNAVMSELATAAYSCSLFSEAFWRALETKPHAPLTDRVPTPISDSLESNAVNFTWLMYLALT